MIDLDRVRSDTPACADQIHFNNAGSSLPPRQVVDAMVEYLRAEELAGGYELAAARADVLDDIYVATASYLNCAPDNVAFTTSASDAWWRAFSAMTLEPGVRVAPGA